MYKFWYKINENRDRHNFSNKITKIVPQALLLIPTYLEFTEMTWEAQLWDRLQTPPQFSSFINPMVIMKSTSKSLWNKLDKR